MTKSGMTKSGSNTKIPLPQAGGVRGGHRLNHTKIPLRLWEG